VNTVAADRAALEDDRSANDAALEQLVARLRGDAADGRRADPNALATLSARRRGERFRDA
jgi:hypothetical protein